MTLSEQSAIIREVLDRFNSVPHRRPETRAWKAVRMAAMCDIRERTGTKYTEIAKLFGVHHSTVMYGCDDALRERRKVSAIRRSRNHGSIELRPIDAVRAHILELSSKGIGARSIYAVTGYATRSITRIKQGKQRWIRPERAAVILAMDETCVADRGLVSSAPTWLLLRELIDEGWTERELCPLIGRSSSRPLHIGVTGTSAKTAMKVAKLYADIQSGKVQRAGTGKSVLTSDNVFAQRSA